MCWDKVIDCYYCLALLCTSTRRYSYYCTVFPSIQIIIYRASVLEYRYVPVQTTMIISGGGERAENSTALQYYWLYPVLVYTTR